jgi:hypothetical protein
MNITGLPFPVNVQGDVGNGGPASLQVHLSPPLDDEGFDQLRCVVVWFAELARRGAFGGATIHPADVLAVLRDDEPDAHGLQPLWHFDQLRVDPAAVTSLANLIYATRLTVRRVALTASGRTATTDLPADHYAARWPSLPFKVEEGATSRSVELCVDFAGDLDPNLSPTISDSLRYWSMVCALGGFRGLGSLQERPDLIPDDDPSITLDQLTFGFRDHGLHDSAYDALLSMLVAFARRHQPIVSVSIT